MQTKPTLVFVPGAWHLPQCFDLVRPIFEAHGFPTEAVANPSIGAEPPTKTGADDAANLRTVLSRLIEDEGKSVVLIARSYGGTVASNASEGLGSVQRAKQGKNGGISLLIYLAAFVLPEGQSLVDGLGGKPSPWMRSNGDYTYSSNEENVFYADMEPEQQQKAISQLSHTSINAFLTPIAHEPFKHMRTGYLFCEQDQALQMPLQETFCSLLETGSKEASLPAPVRASLPSSHSPFFSMPERTVESIEGMIGEI
ncbi:hypothetical protein ASPWEDRAFT_60892 [Aspergillus wentii DTO 134E9]|uniref:AB hydrolase-1 domain-containing protein n=1 Tax=Aspergillus wentii DTO 134E9 TaxID=1073089 RepID=A0A1L9RHZ3_ASPWE|nr:uncharacterized protein ASPWEDRAFT_60892 [Aspergillus wentii DTO 134E9]KAI9925869.1 hypothetical protein MW887_005675 [Aspergillus wentii]OJJ34541.1 hypothetical protein ASPWEDRAFT_60892 [Aspergillus wentii DTO 134E9]